MDGDLHKKSRLDGEITIKINARKLLKGSLMILVLFLVFYLGRISAGTTSLTGMSFSDDVEEKAEKVEVEEPEPEVVEEVAEEEVELAATEDEEETGAEETTDEEEADEDVDYITTYNKVSLGINEVKTDWKGTWGKITGINYAIKNLESGPIKINHFLLYVEGYDDYEKKVPLVGSKQIVKAGTSQSSLATVPNGFSYSEVTAGDLSSVTVTLILYDAGENEVASATKTANLQG